MKFKPMNEPDFTRAVHKRLPDTIWAWKICDPYMGGIPDAYYRHRKTGGAIWIEYKYIKSLPKRDNTMIVPNLSELQLRLLTETVDSGQKAIVIIGFGSKGVILEKSQWTTGISKSGFERRLLSYKELAKEIETRCSVL